MISGVESAHLKVIRADQHIDALKAILRDATGDDSYKIIKDANGKETVEFVGSLAPDIAVLIGEILYQFRSALDHLAFDLVKLNAGKIQFPVNWEERCSFPLKLKPPKGIPKPPVPYGHESFNVLPAISKEAFTFIESVQPYYRRPGTSNVLRLVAQLSNIDKHRHLNVTIRKAAIRQHLKLASGAVFTYGRGGLKHGAEIDPVATHYKADDIVDVQRSVASYVTFDEPTVGKGTDSLEVEHVLEVCGKEIKSIIIPAFTHFLQNP